jgi:hypothetical protein
VAGWLAENRIESRSTLKCWHGAQTKAGLGRKLHIDLEGGLYKVKAAPADRGKWKDFIG